MPKEYIDAVARKTPMGRIADAAEVAELAVFLGSNESSFITGTSVLIDGGYTAL
jgi:NAD(P)-dependent dehydrogenase (short-subunit alcohol dehydrogenase family)